MQKRGWRSYRFKKVTAREDSEVEFCNCTTMDEKTSKAEV